MLHIYFTVASMQSKNLNIRLAPEDLKTFLAAAKADRRTLTSFVIHACYRYANQLAAARRRKEAS